MEGQEFIYHNKKQNTYEWQEQSDGFYNLPERIKWIKDNNLWEEVRESYLHKKNINTNLYKKSRSLYAEAVNDIYNEYHPKEDETDIKNNGLYYRTSVQALYWRSLF